MNLANDGKRLIIEVDGERFERIPVKTHVITDSDSVADVLAQYAKPLLSPGDIVFMSEKAVACTQRRAIPMKDIHPRPLAVFLSRHVYKNPFGIGLSIPQTMEMALQECGTLRILFAAAVSVVMKLFGRRGWFYRVAGEKARSIDGPCDCTIPPYNEYVVLGPVNPEQTAREAAKQAGVDDFAIVDINDLGGNILGVSRPGLNKEWLVKILKDNPLGQSDEQTPLGIIRRVTRETEVSREDIRAWIESRRDDFIADLRRIVRVKSVSEPGAAIAPFGQGCRDVIDEMLALCRERGLAVFNHEYYVGSALLPGQIDDEIGFWAHLDVVPDSGEWQFPAFEATLKDGFIIGRGASDNKGSAVLGLYCLLCARDLGLPLRHSLRVLFGTNEECGMDDIAYYAANYPLPAFSIVPDTEFPVCYGEKGILACELVSPPLTGDLTGLRGGAASNMVADFAAATLESVGEITATGLSKHAALPEGSVNAIGVLCDKLITEKLVLENDAAALGFVRDIAGDFTGAPLNIAQNDDEFGPLTCVAGLLRLEDNRAVLGLNIRYPRSVTGAALVEALTAAAEVRGFAARDFSDNAPNYVARDSAFVRALMETFTEATGRELPAYVMGGGTYARKLPNAVAFGPEFPADMRRPHGLPEGHGGVHEPDEAVSVDDLLAAMEIYMLSILKIDNIDEK